MNKKKILTTALLSVLTLSACGSIAYVSTQNNKNEFISNQLDSNIVEKGISVKCAVVEDSTATYGAQIFSYTVNPNTSLNNVLYKINYVDGTEVENSILTITHSTEDKTIQVNCNSVFTQQIVLTIYLEHDENVKAEVTIDFVEIVEFDYVINCEEGKKLTIEHMFESTGGSVSIPRTITNEVISWDEEFISAVEEKFIECMAEDGYDTSNGYIKKDTTGDSSTMYLNSIGVNYFFNNVYTTADFFYIYDLYWHDNVSGEETYLSLYEFYNLDELLDLNIWNNVINYSCVWNGNTYSCSFEIMIDETALYADEMTSEVISMKFGGEVSSSENESNSTNLVQVFESIDLNGDISTYSQFNMTRGSYMYQNGTYFENSLIKKIGVPIKTINDYTKDNVLTVFVVNFDDVNAKGTEYISKHELVLKANTYTSNTINEWVYFDCSINVGSGETLAFITDTDTIFAGYPSTTLDDYKFKFDVLDGTSLTSSPGNILFDVYKSN